MSINNLEKSNNQEKLNILAEMEGYEDDMEMLGSVMDESVVPGICMNETCDYTVGVEPDASEAYCPVCETHTVSSCFVLAGII